MRVLREMGNTGKKETAGSTLFPYTFCSFSRKPETTFSARKNENVKAETERAKVIRAFTVLLSHCRVGPLTLLTSSVAGFFLHSSPHKVCVCLCVTTALHLASPRFLPPLKKMPLKNSRRMNVSSLSSLVWLVPF